MNKTALITGATAGIGYELSKVFAKNRYNLVIVSRNRAKLDAVAGELGSLHDIQVKVIAKDLCKFSAPQELYIVIRAIGFKYRRVKSSSLQSLERGRPTEIDFLIGYICAKASETSPSDLLNRGGI